MSVKTVSFIVFNIIQLEEHESGKQITKLLPSKNESLEVVAKHTLSKDEELDDRSENYDEEETNDDNNILTNTWCSTLESPTIEGCDDMCNEFVSALSSCDKKLTLQKRLLRK